MPEYLDLESTTSEQNQCTLLTACELALDGSGGWFS